MSKRELDLLVLSDIHLGTYGCNAEELLKYLKSINPKKVILNGDIIDIWQFSKSYWPSSHTRVLKHIMTWVDDDVEVVYIPGNHDEMLRKYIGFNLSNFSVENKIKLNLDGKIAWFFHGDVFDVTMKGSKWLAKLGAIGYDTLIIINSFVNWALKKMGKEKISLSKKIKNSVKKAVSHINNFEQIAADIAISKKYDYVVCGHIHHPIMKEIKTDKGSVQYLNSGDWIENLTSLEYHQGKWSIFRYFDHEEELEKNVKKTDSDRLADKSDEETFNDLIEEFKS